jgi:integrase/recombinase XerD
MKQSLSVVITGPLERYAEGLVAHLLSLAYTRFSTRNLLYVVAHLSRWLAARRLAPRALTTRRVSMFLRERRRAGYSGGCGPGALGAVLKYLRGLGVVPRAPEVRSRTPLDHLLARYAEYLTGERALAESTVRQRVDTAARFLEKHGTRAATRALDPAEIRIFLRRMGQTHSPVSLAGVGTNLRCLLRFLFVEGLVARELWHAVPSAVGWRNRTLPRGLPSKDVQRLLSSCDRRTLVGKRDFAILLLLARLGLRQCEVCALTLDDLDWENGVVTVHGKGKKRAQLPLPSDVGAAVSAYLLRRPRGETRHVFLRVHAPHRPLKVLGAAVFSASQRAGVAPVRPHRLRHTAATGMLLGGASLSEIAQVLRHTSMATTAIYAKVDRRTLRALVQPWPGARS